MADVQVFRSADELAAKVAEVTVDELKTALGRVGSASWVLTGGRTPKRAYEILAQNRNSVDWKNVHILMGDERCVPEDHPDSNWGQAESGFLKHVPVNREKLLSPHAHLGPHVSAERYEKELLALPRKESGLPRLDLVWLGMGEDGHTLSLFPGLSAIENEDRLVVGVEDSPKPPPQRITLTRHAMAGAVSCYILATGSGKAQPVSEALSESAPSTLPVARVAREVEDSGGRVVWLLDADAAALL